MTTPKKTPTKNDLTAFRKSFDKSMIVPTAIERALKELGDGWEKEADFIKRTRIGPIDFSKFRDQFAEFYVEVREAGKATKRIWCGTKAFAQKCREAADGNG